MRTPNLDNNYNMGLGSLGLGVWDFGGLGASSVQGALLRRSPHISLSAFWECTECSLILWRCLLKVLLTWRFSTAPPLSNSWIITIIWLYIALNRTPNLNKNYNMAIYSP